MGKEKVKILHATVSWEHTPEGNVEGIFLSVAEKKRFMGGWKKGIMWIDMGTARDMGLAPPDYRDAKKLKIERWLNSKVIGSEFEIAPDGKLIKREEHMQHDIESCKKRIFHLIRSFEMDLFNEVKIKQGNRTFSVINGKGPIRKSEDKDEEEIKKIKVEQGRLEFPTIYASDGGLSRYSIDTSGNFSIVDLNTHNKGGVQLVCIGGDGRKPDKKARKLYEHYTLLIEKNAKQLRSLMVEEAA